MSSRVNLPHVAALDGLRGAAVAGVVLFHSIRPHLTGGYLGVELFFVLSGFLITSLLLAESTETGRVGLGGFWSRRARRLLPALALLLLGTAIYCVVWAAPIQLGVIRNDAFATIGYVANWRLALRHPALILSPLSHTWSLAIEEQFYLVWPLIFVALLAGWKQAVAHAVLVVGLVLGAISSVLMVMLYDADGLERAYWGTDTRAAPVLFGAALAAALALWGPVRGRTARVLLEALGLAGVAALAVAWTSLDWNSPDPYRGGFFVCALAAVAVLAAVAHPVPGPLARVLGFRPLCLLGLISYGVYLWDWPVHIVLDPVRTGLEGWRLTALQVAVILGISIASYHLVEMPIRRGALGAAQWRVLVPVIATALLVLVVLATTGS